MDPVPRRTAARGAGLGAAAVVVLVLVLVVVLVAVWVGFVWYFRDWVAHNDFAFMRLRLERLLDGEVPLVGAHSRLGVFHPGPLREWLFALPYWSSGRRAAALPATALALNLAWCAVGLYAAWRCRTSWIGAVMSVGLALLVIGMWRELDSPWNPFLAAIPLYVACAATAMSLAGARRAWIVAVVGASFAAQLHASVLVVAVILFAAVMVGVVRAGDGAPRWWWPPLLGAALWIGPIVDLVSHRGEANLIRTLTAADDGTRVGVTVAGAHLARLAWPPSIVRGVVFEPHAIVLDGWSRLWLAVVVAGLAVAVALARGRAGAAAVALATLAGAFVTIAILLEPPYRYLYSPLQSVAVFAVVVLAASVAETLTARDVPVTIGIGLVCISALVAVVAVATTDADDHETAARRELDVEGAVERLIEREPGWTTIWVASAGLESANVAPELADVLYRLGLDPRSDRVQLDLAPPERAGPAIVAAMGQPRACLIAAGAERIADGRVEWVDAEISVFAVVVPDPGLDACLASAF